MNYRKLRDARSFLLVYKNMPARIHTGQRINFSLICLPWNSFLINMLTGNNLQRKIEMEAYQLYIYVKNAEVLFTSAKPVPKSTVVTEFLKNIKKVLHN